MDGVGKEPGGAAPPERRRMAWSRIGTGVLHRVHPGYARTSAMVLPYAQAWSVANEMASAAAGPLWVALGDSTAQGIGASSYERGYVGGLLAWLVDRTEQQWRVVNLSRSGARAADVLAEQLRALDALEAAEHPPDLVTLSVGANDMVRRTPAPRLQATLSEVLDRLPPGAVVATLPQGLGRSRPVEVNQWLAGQAMVRKLVVADLWGHTGPPWAGKFAADGFHPNDDGYRHWLAAFTEALSDR